METPKRLTRHGARGPQRTRSPDGSAITSPKARYLQWRAVLTGKSDGPVLTSINAAYLQRNLRPVVRSITVHPPGIVFQKPFTTGEPELAGFSDQTTPDRRLKDAAQSPQNASSPTLGRRTYQKNLQTIVWRADDENDDDLLYDVLYRREGETEWTPLRRGLDDPIVVWDTTTVPNGTYFVRVVASDSASNSVDTALTGERDSNAFQIDHTPPSIAIGGVRAAGGKTIVSFTVTDADSPVSKVEVLARRRAAVDCDVSVGRHRRFEERTLRADARRSGGRRRHHDSRAGLDEQRGHDPRRRPGGDPPVATPLPYVLLRPRSGGCFPRTVVCATSQHHVDGNRHPLCASPARIGRATRRRRSSSDPRICRLPARRRVASWPS